MPLDLKKILLPVDFPLASLDVIHEAAKLARHFTSEIVLLHVVTARSHAAGVPQGSGELANWDLLPAILQDARSKDACLEQELAGLAIHSELVGGDVVRAIVETAQQEKADLIMMPSHSFTFYQFLMGSVTAKVLHGAECPVWVGAHVQERPVSEFTMHNILAAVKFGPRADVTVCWAAQMAAEFGAQLTLAYVTPSVEMWGPGGSFVDQKWKQALVDGAHEQMATLQQQTGVKANVFIGSGDVPTILSQAARQTKADLLVTGCYPYGGHLRTNGYGIICAVSIPVLSV